MNDNDFFNIPPGSERLRLKSLIERTADVAANGVAVADILTFINSAFGTSFSDIDDIDGETPSQCRRMYAVVATNIWS